ncbi:terpene synthase family protein [Kitasatospora sp. NPDC001574]
MTAAPRALQLPYLHYPYASELHPETDQAENEMIDWLTAYGLLEDPARRTAIRHTRFAEVVGREYPHAESDGLRMVTKVYSWVFVLDDAFCDCGTLGEDVAKLATFHTWMREIMEVGGLEAAESLGRTVTAGLGDADRRLCHRLARAGNDVFQHVAARSSPTQYARFVAEMEYYFLGTLWEASHRVHATMPSPEEYAIGRRMTSATPPALALQDIAAGYEISSHDYHHPAVRELRRITNNVVSWCNDVFSYRKEHAPEGPLPLNLPTALARHEGLDVQAAIEEAARMHNREVEAYLSAEAQVAAWAGPQLSRFLLSMRAMQRGFYDWGLTTPRYSVDRYFSADPRTG